jgi:hypothetical protein
MLIYYFIACRLEELLLHALYWFITLPFIQLLTHAPCYAVSWLVSVSNTHWLSRCFHVIGLPKGRKCFFDVYADLLGGDRFIIYKYIRPRHLRALASYLRALSLERVRKYKYKASRQMRRREHHLHVSSRSLVSEGRECMMVLAFCHCYSAVRE